MPKKRYHHGNLREALVRAATELVEESGAEAFTLAAASRSVGVTHAAAYKHFADRTALLHAVSSYGMQAFGDVLQAAFEQHDDPEAQYLATGRAVVSFASRRPHLYRLSFSSIRRDDLTTLSAPPEGTALARFIAMIEVWQTKGWLKDGDPSHWALVLWTSAHGLAMLVASGRLDVSPTAAQELSDEVLRSVHAGIG
ncbi:MAG: TetR/AcrR family transcriptional regulator [Myxococcota bacterium]